MTDNHEDKVLQQFLADTAEHEMQVLHENGLYRHLRFKRPKSPAYWFDIVTWPGHLAITGDVGSSVFSRQAGRADMFQFFQPDPDCELLINAKYGTEKLVANDGDRFELDKKLFRQAVQEQFEQYIEQFTDVAGNTPSWANELWEEIEDRVLDLDDDSIAGAIRAMDEFLPVTADHKDFRFEGAWAYAESIRSYEYRLIWRLYAIAYAVRRFRDHQKQPKHAAEAAPSNTEAERWKQHAKELGQFLHDQIVANQAAWIEWQHGKGAEAAMTWIHNGLIGPGHIPSEEAPYGREAQAWYDANCSSPFPACYCGRPSNRVWMGQGFCCEEHFQQRYRQHLAETEGAAQPAAQPDALILDFPGSQPSEDCPHG